MGEVDRMMRTKTVLSAYKFRRSEEEEALQAIRSLCGDEDWQKALNDTEREFVMDFEDIEYLTEYEHKVAISMGDIFYMLRVGHIDEGSEDWEILKDAKHTELLNKYVPRIDELFARWGR
jgi:hypothetical protein